MTQKLAHERKLAHDLKLVYELKLAHDLNLVYELELVADLITGPGEQKDRYLAVLVKCAEDLIPRKLPVSITLSLSPL